VNEQQIVLAAEITNNSTDFSRLAPTLDAVLGELARAGIPRRPAAIAADAGYCNEQQMDELVADKHIPVLVAPDKGSRDTRKRWPTSGRATWMRALLGSEDGRERYGKRKQTVDPLYGDTKHNKGFTRFHRRGRMKVRSTAGGSTGTAHVALAPASTTPSRNCVVVDSDLAAPWCHADAASTTREL
jgi:hypothetical protein